MSKPYADETPMRRVAPLLLLLLAAIAVILAAVAGLSHLWNVGHGEGQSESQPSGEAPALETTPQSALQDYLSQKQHMAGNYSWIDPARQLARIPVEEAMRALAAQSGLPPGQREAHLMGLATEPRSGPPPEIKP